MTPTALADDPLCVACGHATKDRYFANSASPDFGTGPRRLRLPVVCVLDLPTPAGGRKACGPAQNPPPRQPVTAGKGTKPHERHARADDGARHLSHDANSTAPRRKRDHEAAGRSR